MYINIFRVSHLRYSQTKLSNTEDYIGYHTRATMSPCTRKRPISNFQPFCPDSTETTSSSLLVSLPSIREVSPSLLNAAHSPSMSRCNEATFAPLRFKNERTSLACRHPRGSFGVALSFVPSPAVWSTHPYKVAKCMLALTFFASPPLFSWSKKVASDFAASTLDLKTCRMILRVGGGRFWTDLTGGSSTVGGAMVPLVCCSHGFAAGVGGVVYCERAAKDRSQRFGAQTPT